MVQIVNNIYNQKIIKISSILISDRWFVFHLEYWIILKLVINIYLLINLQNAKY